MADLYAQPGHLLWRAAARVTREVDRLLPGNVDLHSYAVLVALADHEPQSQRSLASSTGVSGTTLTAVAHTLKADGLVERVRNPEDRRSYSLTRTAAGRDAVRRWEPHVRRLEQQLTAHFRRADARRLRELLLAVAGDDLDRRTPRPLLDSTGFLVAKAHQRIHREFASALEPLDVEPRHLGTLRALRIVGPATQGTSPSSSTSVRRPSYSWWTISSGGAWSRGSGTSRTAGPTACTSVTRQDKSSSRPLGSRGPSSTPVSTPPTTTTSWSWRACSGCCSPQRPTTEPPGDFAGSARAG